MNKESMNGFHASLLSAPLQIQFDITNKCNFRCLHCYNKSGANIVCDNELSDNQVEDLFDEFKTMRLFNICFCGGEPLLRKDLIVKVANNVKDCIPNLAIVTTGYFLDEKVLDELSSSGVKRIQISLDGFKKETHEKLRCKKGAFDRALDAIKLCISNKSKLKEIMVCFSPTIFNIHEFPKLFEYLMVLGVDCVRVQPLMLSGRARQNSFKLKPKDYQYDQLFSYVNKFQREYGKNKLSWGDPVDHIIRFRKYLSNICTNVTIKADGNIIATPYIPISFGNIKRHSFKEYWDKGLPFIWQNSELQKYARNINIVEDIGRDISGYPILWEEDDIDCDIINK
ncbi:radical SAM protein [Candidatus Gracilibacteria bacterium]|nr:MAG: radical SAM protein [Candidatus Gracilibacteria bacterium]